MIIDCISDLHSHYPTLEGGDILIVAGDLTARHTIKELDEFNEWIREQKYKKKLLVAGNHDTFFEHGVYHPVDVDTYHTKSVFIDPSCDYLFDSGFEFEGLKIWGSPWTPWFHGVHPKCKAFMKKDKQLKKYWDMIPDDIDILITHSPPYGILDQVPTDSKINKGSKSLRNSIEKIMPEMVLFGHIHEQGGKYVQKEGILYINGSLVDERYRNVNRARRIIFDEEMPKMQRFKVIE